MPYDPHRHHRRSIRLQGYDYAQAGAYFVTIVTQGRECLFGEVVDGEMRLNVYGEAVWEEWDKSGRMRREIALDAFVVMPNHVHAIVVIDPEWPDDSSPLFVGAQGLAPLPPTAPLHPPEPWDGVSRVAPRSLASFVRGFKSGVTMRVNALRGTVRAAVWQRNYYEHVIRDEPSLDRIRDYIAGNPAAWEADPENPSLASGRDAAGGSHGRAHVGAQGLAPLQSLQVSVATGRPLPAEFRAAK